MERQHVSVASTSWSRLCWLMLHILRYVGTRRISASGAHRCMKFHLLMVLHAAAHTKSRTRSHFAFAPGARSDHSGEAVHNLRRCVHHIPVVCMIVHSRVLLHSRARDVQYLQRLESRVISPIWVCYAITHSVTHYIHTLLHTSH